ncbi:hypothetical protein F5Y09DRAFT_354278 [Xylaria sp. FL1042]|nr:hypothetical protein F5Y09DRAFT_354278 [Xylaria sp. FL1042]
MKGDMVASGWNSLVIPAACHVPDIEHNQDEHISTDESDSFLREHTQAHDTDLSNTIEEDQATFNNLLDLSHRKLRWGAVHMPRKLVEFVSSEREAVSHL